jgi:hypothetical protein
LQSHDMRIESSIDLHIEMRIDPYFELSAETRIGLFTELSVEMRIGPSLEPRSSCISCGLSN